MVAAYSISLVVSVAVYLYANLMAMDKLEDDLLLRRPDALRRFKIRTAVRNVLFLMYWLGFIALAACLWEPYPYPLKEWTWFR